jgi:hypothetical protein
MVASGSRDAIVEARISASTRAGHRIAKRSAVAPPID